MKKFFNKNVDWIRGLLKSSHLFDAKHAMDSINAGCEPVIVDKQCSFYGFDEVLDLRIKCLESAQKGSYEHILRYTLIELLNNYRANEYAHFISAVIVIEGGRFLLYISPDKKKLLGCLFNAKNKQRPDSFLSTCPDTLPIVKTEPSKISAPLKWLMNSALTATILLIVFWPQLTQQVTHYLDKPCISNIQQENYSNAFVACSTRMNEGSRSAMFWVGKLYQDGTGVKKNYTISEKLYKKLTTENDSVSSLAYLGLGDLYKAPDFIKRDLAEAARYYKISADMGQAHSQLQYGLALFIGRGVERNEEQALAYLSKSAKNGNEYAEELLEQLQTIPSDLFVKMMQAGLQDN